MSHTHSTTKRRTFKHLNAYQRGQIEAMLRLGVPKVKIAKDLGIARSTLYEEIKRGTVTQKRSDWTYYEQYFAQSGQIRYERNRENAGKPSKFNAAQDFIRYVENAILKDKHSPDAICGRAKRMNLFEVSVCTKTIYNYITMGLLKVKNIDLRQKVRRRKRKEKRTMTTAGRSVRVLTAVTLLLTNAPPLEIGNLTPSSGKRERILFCLPQMNVRSERDTL
nr:hypothetical protein [uncultured Selenomonas sp.]